MVSLVRFTQNFVSQHHSTIRGMLILSLLTVSYDFAYAERNMSFQKDQWSWLLAVAVVLSVGAAWGIGANDVANAFATSVGSKALTVKQAIFLGAICEPLGAVLLGGKVMETMRKGISDHTCYQDNPALIMYGMTCVLMSVAIWLALATYLKMPVSTTHSCVGGIIGMTIMTRGTKCVTWNYKPHQYCIKSNADNYNDCVVSTMGWDDFPWLDGVSEIIISWLLSPFFSGVCASILYCFTRFCIMERQNSYPIVLCLFPIIVGFTCWMNYMYIVLKGAKAWDEDLNTAGQVREAKSGNLTPAALWGCLFAGTGAAITVICEYFIIKNIQNRVARGELQSQESIHGQPTIQHDEENRENPDLENIQNTEIYIGNSTDVTNDTPSEINEHTFPVHEKGILPKTSPSIINQLNKNVLECITEGTGDGNETIVRRIHSKAKYYDSRTEEVFKYVQVFTAMVDSFSHGANDVANAMGPFSAIYFAWKNGYVDKKPQAANHEAKWILLMGGLGITLGLISYGYRIMQAIGVELVSITPSRGYCIELGAAFVIIYGSSQGWPLSTTHCQIGATVFVGLFDGFSAVNGRELAIVVFGWVATLVFVGLLSALLVGPSPEPIKGMLHHNSNEVRGYCENYIPWETQIAVGRGAPGYSLTTPSDL